MSDKYKMHHLINETETKEQEFQRESCLHQHTIVAIPSHVYNRIIAHFDKMTSENKGFWSFFKRWKINHEPLRADAETLWKELCWLDSRKKLVRETKTYRVDSKIRNA